MQQVHRFVVVDRLGPETAPRLLPLLLELMSLEDELVRLHRKIHRLISRGLGAQGAGGRPPSPEHSDDDASSKDGTSSSSSSDESSEGSDSSGEDSSGGSIGDDGGNSDVWVVCPVCRARHRGASPGILVFVSTECPVCLEVESPTVALPCGHTLCRNDYQSLCRNIFLYAER